MTIRGNFAFVETSRNGEYSLVEVIGKPNSNFSEIRFVKGPRKNCITFVNNIELISVGYGEG